MFILISYLISLVSCTYTLDGTTLKIVDEASITMTEMQKYTTATECIITADSVSVGNQAFRFNAALQTVTIDAKTVNLEAQSFQQATISQLIKVKAETLTVGKTAFISATVGGVEMEAGKITLEQQAFQQITKAANVTLLTNSTISIGMDCFITSPIEEVTIKAVGNINLEQQAFQQCTQITNLVIESTEGGISIGKDAFISAAMNDVYFKAYLDINIEQQAFQQVGNFNNLVAITNGNVNAKITSFISSTIKQFYIHSGANVTFGQQAFQETKNLVNFTVIANDEIRFEISSFHSSNVNSIRLVTNGSVYFGQQSFQECINLTSLVIEGGANITFGNSCFIASQIQALNVTTIDGNSTASGAMLLADSSTISFEKQSFSQCNQLTKVDVHTNGNVDVGAETFQDSKALKNINIHATKATVGDNAFAGCPLDGGKANIDAETQDISGNAYGDGGDDGDSGKKKGGSSSHKDSDDKDESSAKTLGNFDIESVYLGTSPNIVVNLNIFVTLMRKARLAFGRVVPSPDFIHSAIWVGKDKEVNDKSVGAIFVYGKYWNKFNMDTYLEKDGAKAIVMTLGEFKKRYPSINPMKLKAKKNMKLFDFINEVKAGGHWGARDYNWPTNNCQHFTAKLINILHATRDAPASQDWVDLPKPVMNALKANEKN